jgi:carbon storage regulator CsrA
VLVLARKPGEWLQIGDIQVKVISVKGNVVRLGTSAPAHVKVLRGPEMVHEDGSPRQSPRDGEETGA